MNTHTLGYDILTMHWLIYDFECIPVSFRYDPSLFSFHIIFMVVSLVEGAETVFKKGGTGEKKGTLKNSKQDIYSMRYLKKAQI